MLKRILAVILILSFLFSFAASGEAATYKRLQKGSRGDEVRALQTELKNQGYYSGKVDGIYGKATVKAVREFQERNGLKADGIAGQQTQEKLYALRDASDPAEKPESRQWGPVKNNQTESETETAQAHPAAETAAQTALPLLTAAAAHPVKTAETTATTISTTPLTLTQVISAKPL